MGDAIADVRADVIDVDDAAPYRQLASLRRRSSSPQLRAAAAPPMAVASLCSSRPEGHDASTKASIAAGLARLLGTRYAGTFDVRRPPKGRHYLVPDDTLLADDADRLGVCDWRDLFGGVVPFGFVATKLITHPLVHVHAAQPAGWSVEMGEGVRDVVLDGYSAFDADDAKAATARLLAHGAVRIKDAQGVGGHGQAVVRSLDECDAALAATARGQAGWVVERNLNDVRTWSVGQVRVAEMLLSYHGEQRLTRNHHGEPVYGGSTLHMVRGDFDALLREPLADNMQLAVRQALGYHRAAMRCFPGLIASRCNYDIVQGVDDSGAWRSGVLEQSWRIGGASGAELVALQLLREQPELRWVEASTHEVYGPTAPPPANAEVHFDGTDPVVGRLLKYATVDRHGTGTGTDSGR